MSPLPSSRCGAENQSRIFELLSTGAEGCLFPRIDGLTALGSCCALAGGMFLHQADQFLRVQQCSDLVHFWTARRCHHVWNWV